ncbi:MAG: T9SS type A sorting domain-containing protein [Lewinella sp.]
MAYTPLKISIPKPCHEDWNGMHPVPGTTARHCDSCAKNVVDFTGFSDAKMHAYVREQGGKLCGRFRPDQLNRPLRAVSTPTSNPLKVAAVAAGVMLAATGCDTPKEITGAPTPDETWEILTDGLILEPPTTVGVSLEQAENHLSSSHEPEVAVPLVGKIAPPPPPPLSKVGEISAIPLPPPAFEETVEGEIMIELPEDLNVVTCGTKSEAPPEVDPDFLVGDIDINEEVPELPPTILIEQDTTPPSGKILTAEDIRNLPTRNIESMPAVVMGIVMMEHPRPTGLDWVKDTLKSVLPSLPKLPSQDPSLHQRPRPEMPEHLEAVSVYPNPFIDHLKIDIELPAEEILTVELLDPTGRLVFSKLWKAVAGANTLTIEPKQRKLKHAIYYLRITNEREFSVVKTVLK